MDKVQLGPRPFMCVMPAMLLGANVNGKPNYMTAAWATAACMAPPMVCVADQPRPAHAEGHRGERHFQPERPLDETGGRDRTIAA